jgi:hypothetical protein
VCRGSHAVTERQITGVLTAATDNAVICYESQPLRFALSDKSNKIIRPEILGPGRTQDCLGGFVGRPAAGSRRSCPKREGGAEYARRD